MAADKQQTFSFQLLDGKRFTSIEGKEARELLMKWSMKDRIKAQMYSFDQPFQVYQSDEFIKAFFQDSAVISTMQVLSSSGKWVPLNQKATDVSIEHLKCSVISMSFFDRLTENGIVRENGNICKCFDEFYEEFVVSDELRKCLLIEDSDNFEIFSESDRQEFLFCLFKHLCLGGQVCQFEDNVQPYLDTTKSVYKDLVSVQKDSKTNDLIVSSFVFKVCASDANGMFLPSSQDNVQDFLYLIVDPMKRHVTTFYHRFGAVTFSE